MELHTATVATVTFFVGVGITLFLVTVKMDQNSYSAGYDAGFDDGVKRGGKHEYLSKSGGVLH